MKNFSYIKRALLQSTFILAALIISSCTETQQPEDSKTVAEEQNDAKFDTYKQEKDAQFLVNAAEITLEEIQLGQLAQQKGKTKHIKDLGVMMTDAHNKSLIDLTALAKNKTVSIPTALTDNARDAHKELNNKSGADFEKAYADLMVSRHKDAIAVFEKASTDCEDTDIKNWASATLPVLRKHLDHSMDCQKKLSTMYLEKTN